MAAYRALPFSRDVKVGEPERTGMSIHYPAFNLTIPWSVVLLSVVLVALILLVGFTLIKKGKP